MAEEGQAQCTGMLSREQLLCLFERFETLISQPDVKKRIADAVNDQQVKRLEESNSDSFVALALLNAKNPCIPEAVAVTTAIQEEVFLEMGVDPGFGIGCLGKVNVVYENDRELMIRFYGFVAKEEMACDEAELGPDEFVEKICNQQKLQEQQLEMLKYMRKFHMDDQSAVLEKLHEQMQNANFDSRASIMSVDRIEEFVRTRSTHMARPSQHG